MGLDTFSLDEDFQKPDRGMKQSHDLPQQSGKKRKREDEEDFKRRVERKLAQERELVKRASNGRSTINLDIFNLFGKLQETITEYYSPSISINNIRDT